MILLSRMLVLSCLVALCPLAFAQEVWEPLLSAHGQRVEASQTQRSLDLLKLRQSYKSALEQAQSAARARGDLELLLALGAEIERVDGGVTPPETLSEKPEVARLQGILLQQVRAVDSSHAARVQTHYRLAEVQLNAVQQDLVRAGNIEAALAVDGKRKALAQDTELQAANAWLAMFPSIPQAGSRRMPKSLAEAERLFRGKVLSFHPETLAIEVAYDFSDVAQLKDFHVKRPDQIRIEDGKLVLGAPPHSDWWIASPFSATALVAGFVEGGKVSLSIDCLDVSKVVEQHVVLGFSDLDRRTIGLGPLGTIQSFAVEGWTPKKEDFRDRTSQAAYQFPAKLSASKNGGDIDFGTLVGKRLRTLSVASAPEMKHPGLFAKAWSAKPAQASFDNLIVKGTLRAGWLAERVE